MKEEESVKTIEGWWFYLGYYNESYFSYDRDKIMKNKDYFNGCFEKGTIPFDSLNKFNHYLNHNDKL
jgi:hypothetical protein